MSKRFHVHMHVKDLEHSIGFYSKLFGAEPTRREKDYAKWMLEDPKLNFAISTWGERLGIDHLGMQTDDADELRAMREHAAAADFAMSVEDQVSCCYARSDKHWITDPQGVAWEQFQTLADVPTFSPKSRAATAAAPACCAPRSKAAGGTVAAAPTGCCG
ncbi:MAG: glyoxalase/bleomycin resistance/dioxygenase family protein [Aquincola sp.]|nr:glyoxalase/bleomycin resistance/dioxygenase family protein [Aquincola sp.]MDH5330819.1 glyoxalase/bleomycin resistance/dioxygenase family protein [Aquincola sp.]